MRKVPINGLDYEYDEDLCADLSHNRIPLTGLDGQVIYAVCFSREVPDSHIFPDDMTGVTFINCNLDNVYIPPGNTVLMLGGGSQKRFKVQNDLNDWIIDETDKPLRPIDHKYYTKLNLPMPDPKNIPIAQATAPLDLKAIAKSIAIAQQEII